MGESYNGIHTLADLFRIVKIPNKLFGAIARERLLYLSSCLVVLVSYLFKKNLFSSSYLYLHPFYHGAALYPKLLCS